MGMNGSDTRGTTARRAALILAGAAGKGPFAAGALARLAMDERFEIRRVVGASSGALNAAVYAAGLRVGAPDEAAQLLCDLWRDEASWSRILRWKWRVAIVRKALATFEKRDAHRKVQLHVAVASLRGRHEVELKHVAGSAEPEKIPYLRFEEGYMFDTADFADSGRLDHMAEICMASAAIPFVFAPQKVGGSGPYWDGGIVNNTPIRWAITHAPDIDHLIVVTPDSAAIQERRYGRFSFWRLLEIVIEERLSRDLQEARSFNREIVKLCKMGVPLERLSAELKWRLLQFVEIRPNTDPRGNLGTGFFSRGRRLEYIKRGYEAADKALATWREEDFAACSDPKETGRVGAAEGPAA